MLKQLKEAKFRGEKEVTVRHFDLDAETDKGKK